MEPVLTEFPKFDTFSIDIETTGLNPHDSRMMMCQIGFPNDTQFVIDARKVNLKPLIPYLQSSDWKKIFFNGKFDEQFFLKFYNSPIINVWDCYIHERILQPELKGNQAFEDAAWERLGVRLDKTTRKSFLGGQTTPYTEKQIRYGAEDVSYLFPLVEIQQKLIADIGQSHIADLENEVVTIVANMEYIGVPVNADSWKEKLNEYALEHEESRRRLMELFNKPVKDLGNQMGLFDEGKSLESASINLGSPAQIKAAFAGIGIYIPDTKDETISVLPYPSAKELTKYRGLDKIMTSYGMNSFVNKIHPFTGHIHPNWHQVGTETGRFSCSQPNMQQIPEKFRSSVGGESEYDLLGADFSQMELRILAQESKDPKLVDAFVNNKDIHTATASTMFNIPLEKVTKEQRFTAKTLNFGITYGMGIDKFVKMMNGEAQKTGGKEITIPQAQRLMDLYKANYIVANKYLANIGLSAIRDGVVETRYGRKRYFKQLPTSLSPKEYSRQLGGIKRAGANMPIQGNNADITKLAMVEIHNELKSYGFKANIILQVHDELVLLTHKSQIEEVKSIVTEAMVKAGQSLLPDIPVKVDSYVASYWPK